MSYAGMSMGYGGGMQPTYAYQPTRTPYEEAESRKQAAAAYYQTPEGQREMYERGLQQQEQQRRQYDSESNRQMQEAKYGVLGGLVKQFGSDMSGGGYGGFGSGPRVIKSIHSSSRPAGSGGFGGSR